MTAGTVELIDRSAALTPEERDEVIAVLSRHAVGHGFPYEPQTLALVLRQDGAVAGGLLGSIAWNWLHVQILGVADALRGRGYGRSLMLKAEAKAQAQGCTGIWLDTISFQAPGFYEKLGYRRFGELPNYPADQTRIFFEKRLIAG